MDSRGCRQEGFSEEVLYGQQGWSMGGSGGERPSEEVLY